MLRDKPLYGDAKKELVIALLNGKDVSKEAFMILCQVFKVKDAEFIYKYTNTLVDDDNEDDTWPGVSQ